ncbi:hypothetical protein INR49_032542, partial [Caranx melampygus]
MTTAVVVMVSRRSQVRPFSSSTERFCSMADNWPEQSTSELDHLNNISSPPPPPSPLHHLFHWIGDAASTDSHTRLPAGLNGVEVNCVSN